MNISNRVFSNNFWTATPYKRLSRRVEVQPLFRGNRIYRKTTAYLHGHAIAIFEELEDENILSISLSGWHTPLTVGALNALLECRRWKLRKGRLVAPSGRSKELPMYGWTIVEDPELNQDNPGQWRLFPEWGRDYNERCPQP